MDDAWKPFLKNTKVGRLEHTIIPGAYQRKISVLHAKNRTTRNKTGCHAKDFKEITDSCKGMRNMFIVTYDKYVVVTYELAVAKTARQIQVQNSPKCDNCFAEFCQFHTILSLLSSIGKLLEGSGAAYLPSLAQIIAGGSINQISKAKTIKSLSSWESFASSYAWFTSRKIY